MPNTWKGKGVEKDRTTMGRPREDTQKVCERHGELEQHI